MDSPTTKLLKSLKERLGPLGFPVHFKLPSASVAEPFAVVGAITSDTSKTAQTGLIIEDSTVQIDIYLSGSKSRVYAENVKSQAIRLLGRSTRTTSSILMDNSIGREVYHIVIRMTETIL
ncbi:hypothetical protein ACVRXQ_12115 [Streptococcus panodentis]|uniref:Phage protein n=1 Tax=Streptococcus panodentis TaxID=1581472 RepID=A0ABS5AZJ3_9STRE|nr:hypothetical protein [Streptococcus panodentis]MBP2621124.1 hypothetical protein [Streptococcus panodentis]